MSKQTPPRYWRTSVPRISNDPLPIMSELLNGARRTLEIGPGSGVLAKVLKQRGTRVFGIEMDPRLIEPSRHLFEKIIVGDVERLDISSLLFGEEFDAIVFGDVLEHLRSPDTVLRSLLPFLTKEGSVVASIPNVAHGAVRLALADGKFDYGKGGLLDSNHLRFFTRSSIVKLFEEVQLHIHRWRYVVRDPLETEIPVEAGSVPDVLIAYLRTDPDSFVYQYVIEAKRSPIDSPDERSVPANTELPRVVLDEPDPAHELDRLRSDLAGANARIATLAQENESLAQENESLHHFRQRILSLPGAGMIRALLRARRFRA